MVALRWDSHMRRMLGDLRKPALRKLVKPILDMVTEVISPYARSVSRAVPCNSNEDPLIRDLWFLKHCSGSKI